ncbi:MAG: SseB family protein [Erysipelotrichaceae bacterium]|nr:SseB family protein [Erysipelotrichaceae bacterium]
MNYKETGFRAFYHHFCSFPLTEKTAKCIEGFPRAEEANAYLTYGYIDSEAGLTLEVVAAARVSDDGIEYFEPSNEIRSIIRIETVAEDPFRFEPDEDGELEKRYADKVSITKEYAAEEEVEKTREMTFLDGCRHESCIDDVMVYLIKEGNKPEGCWARIIGLGDHFFMGVLLNEPDQDFGYHAGEKIAFFVQETEEKKIICISDMNPSQKITAEELEDGSMLEAAVRKFNEERNETNFIDILEILRDSFVWVPCTAVMSDEDQKRMEELIESLNGDFEKLAGMEFTAQDETRLIPDILQNGDNFFFPIFSTAEAMGEYGDNFSKVQKHILEVIPLARNNEKEPVGIVLNAFSEPFILDKEIWDMVENMKSRIQ